jgi:hypothetical protein
LVVLIATLIRLLLYDLGFVFIKIKIGNLNYYPRTNTNTDLRFYEVKLRCVRRILLVGDGTSDYSSGTSSTK